MSDQVVGPGGEPDPRDEEFRAMDAEAQATPEWDSDSHLRGVIDEYMGSFEPEPEDTAGLRERILQLVREDLRRGPSTRLQTERGNPYSISTASVRSIVRDAVDSVDGIRARSVDVEAAGEPEGSAATVRLTVAMRAGISFNSTAEVIRHSVSAAIQSELGLPAVQIDIDAEDVYVD